MTWLLQAWGWRRLSWSLIPRPLFSLFSALCGGAADPSQLVLFRALQGLAGGLLVPVAGTLLFRGLKNVGNPPLWVLDVPGLRPPLPTRMMPGTS